MKEGLERRKSVFQQNFRPQFRLMGEFNEFLENIFYFDRSIIYWERNEKLRLACMIATSILQFVSFFYGWKKYFPSRLLQKLFAFFQFINAAQLFLGVVYS